MPEDNGKENPEGSYTKKYQKHIACSYGYKLVCVDDTFSKPFKTCLGEGSVFNFINSIIEEYKYCSAVMKKHFNRKLVMTIEDNGDFKNSTKCWICDNDYNDNNVNVRDHCHITGKYRGSAQGGCNINLKLNHKTPNVFHNLIIQELGRLKLKRNVIANGSETYMSFAVNNKLSLIDNFQFLSFSLNSLIKNLSKNDFEYLSQEFDNNVLELIMQKGFYHHEYMSDFEIFKKKIILKIKFF